MVSDPDQSFGRKGSLPTFFFTIIPGAILTPTIRTVSKQTGLNRGPALAERRRPVAQALVQLTTGMPVCPINCRVR